MAKGKEKEVAAALAENAGPRPVLGATWDPSDPSQNHNADQPVYASPKAVPHQAKIIGHEPQEGAGEPRPMFSSSLKEY